MGKPGPETLLVKRIQDAILNEWPQAWVVKIAGGMYQTVGIPDLVMCIDGMFVGLEAKAPHVNESEESIMKRVSATQQATLEAIHRAGGITLVAWSVESALGLLRDRLGVDP
jgi:hypothetical protein